MTQFAAASREALATARAALPASGGAQTGRDLFAVVDALDADRTLRSALVDSSTPASGRAEIARSVFGGKIGADALAVVIAAAGATWSSEDDLVAGLVLLGREALLGAAKAAGSLDAVEDELFRLGRIVEANPELEQALTDRSRTRADRVALVDRLISGKVTDITGDLARQAIGRLSGFPADALAELSVQAAAFSDRAVAQVRSATALSDDQRQRLAASLARTFGREVTVHVEVDPTILGGLVVRVGDEQIDGSVAGKLATLRRGLR